MADDDEKSHVGGLRRNLSRLRTQETNIVRQLAENEDLHGNALTRALDEIEADLLTVEKELSRIEEAQRGTLTVESVR